MSDVRAAPRPERRLHRRLGALPALAKVCLLAIFGSRLISFAAFPFLALRASAVYGFSTMGAAALVSVAPLISIAASGRLSGVTGRLGQRRTLVLALALLSLAFWSVGLGRSAGALWLAVVCLGLCRATFDPACAALLSESTGAAEQSLVFTARYSAINLGVVSGPFVGALLASHFSPLQFQLAGAAALLLTLLVALVVLVDLHRRGARAPMAQRLPDAIDWGSLLRDPLLLLYVAFVATLAAVEGQTDSLLPLFLREAMGEPEGVTFFALLLIANATLVLALQKPALRLFDRCGARVAFTASGLLHAAGVFSLALGLRFPVLAGAVGMVLISCGEVVFGVCEGVLTDRFAQPGAQGAYYGVLSIANAGFVAGPILAGAVQQRAGWSASFLLLGLLPLGFALAFFRCSAAQEARIQRLSDPGQQSPPR